MLPRRWRPEPYNGLVRVGPDADGGYVIPAATLDSTETLVSLGLSDDWRFEEDFLRRSSATAVCYDHTVNRSFWRWRAVIGAVALRRVHGPLSARIRDLGKYWDYRAFFDGERARHHQIMVGFEADGSTSLTNILQSVPGRIFIKMDIEGWEYRVLDQLLPFEDRVLGFVVEFHDVDLHREWISDFIQRANCFVCVHWHANNFGHVDDSGDPTVLEATFVHRDLPETTHEVPGGKLDFPNCPTRPDVRPVFEPAAQDG